MIQKHATLEQTQFSQSQLFVYNFGWQQLRKI